MGQRAWEGGLRIRQRGVGRERRRGEGGRERERGKEREGGRGLERGRGRAEGVERVEAGGAGGVGRGRARSRPWQLRAGPSKHEAAARRPGSPVLSCEEGRPATVSFSAQDASGEGRCQRGWGLTPGWGARASEGGPGPQSLVVLPLLTSSSRVPCRVTLEKVSVGVSCLGGWLSGVPSGPERL